MYAAGQIRQMPPLKPAFVFTVALLGAKMLSAEDLSCLFQPTNNLRIHFYMLDNK